MDCGQAQNLFDAYLDGELSPSLAAELDAHRVQCAECRRSLALLEVSEHILALDQDPVSLDAEFSDRLAACVARQSSPWRHRLARWAYVGGPVAAAAVIALAFLGVFDGRRETEVAGDRVEVGIADVFNDSASDAASPATSPQDALFDLMLDRAQNSLRAKQRSVESLQSAFDFTLRQPLDLFDQAQQRTPASTTPPSRSAVEKPSTAPRNPKSPPQSSDNDLEDL